jgi:hypothetical protein
MKLYLLTILNFYIILLFWSRQYRTIRTQGMLGSWAFIEIKKMDYLCPAVTRAFPQI